ncbi:MAG TPA: TOBE domain-containing protein [Noviherbaspirillum sp.]
MNRLPGTVSAVDVHGSIALVDVQVREHLFTATLIGAGEDIAEWKPGMAVMLLFKETEVSLAKNLTGLLSMRNRLPCTVAAIERGRLLTRVELDFGGDAIESVITTRSSLALDLAVGDTVEGLVKANEMTLIPETEA